MIHSEDWPDAYVQQPAQSDAKLMTLAYGIGGYSLKYMKTRILHVRSARNFEVLSIKAKSSLY